MGNIHEIRALRCNLSYHFAINQLWEGTKVRGGIEAVNGPIVGGAR